MFVKGGQIVVDAERVSFIPNRENRYQNKKPLSASYPLTSYYTFAFRKALAEAFLFGYGRVEAGDKLIEVFRKTNLFSLRILSTDEERGSSFKLTKNRLIALFNSLDSSSRFEEIVVRNGKTLRMVGDISTLILQVDNFKTTLDRAAKNLLRNLLWNIFEVRGKSVNFHEAGLSITSEVPFVRLTDIRLTVGNFKAPLDREIILKLLALC